MASTTCKKSRRQESLAAGCNRYADRPQSSPTNVKATIGAGRDLNHPFPHRPDSGLGAVAHGDLAEDVLHMLLHGLDADRERAADLLVAQAERHVAKHLSF